MTLGIVSLHYCLSNRFNFCRNIFPYNQTTHSSGFSIARNYITTHYSLVDHMVELGSQRSKVKMHDMRNFLCFPLKGFLRTFSLL